MARIEVSILQGKANMANMGNQNLPRQEQSEENVYGDLRTPTPPHTKNVTGEVELTQGVNFKEKSDKEDHDLNPWGRAALVYEEPSDLEKTTERSPTPQPTAMGAGPSMSNYRPWGNRFVTKAQRARFSALVGRKFRGE